jgi:DNA repair photolyase
MATLAEHGIQTGVTMMPILPFIEDTSENITAIVERAAACGATYIIPWIGMSLRDRQRTYFYRQLDQLFPGLRKQYERTFGDRYTCQAPDAPKLYTLFEALCERYGIATRMPPFAPQTARQLALF